jgi:hypothetical protein
MSTTTFVGTSINISGPAVALRGRCAVDQVGVLFWQQRRLQLAGERLFFVVFANK